MSSRKPRLFEYKGQWIGRESGRAGLYRYWFQGRNTRRRKLAAVELEQAVPELIAIVEAAPADAGTPDQVMFAVVVKSYRKRVLLKKRKIWTDPATGEERESLSTTESGFNLSIKRLTAFMEMLVDGRNPRSPHKAAFRVGELTLTAQQAFWRYLNDKHQLSPKAISIYMATIAAAINKATEPYIDDVDGTEREIRILSQGIRVSANVREIADAIGESAGPRHIKSSLILPTFKQMAEAIDSIPDQKRYEHAFRYFIVALNTWARPEAVHDLNFFHQINYEYGIVDLNPADREQTKKHRPIIRLTESLKAWALYWNEPYPITWRGERAKSAKKTIKSAWREAGFEARSRYDLRSFMSTHARRLDLGGGRRMDSEQKSIWLGHKLAAGSSTSDFYMELDPDYLQEAMEATDRIILEINHHLKKRSLIAPTVEVRQGLTVYKGNKS
ncbi:hypothetical protein [Roseibium album]|uniref:hypothetical protein n=1 Tax=Roseibium album TaxID=311410 RepID=UPI0024900BC3|nr:hypothetical protein [Roseibium album]